jgi:hyaluronan synthase
VFAGSLLLHHRLAGADRIPLLAAAVWGSGLAFVVAQIILAWAAIPCTSPVPDVTVAVVVPCYNEDPAYLIRVLESIRAQTRRPDWVVVCDDGSTVSYDGIPEAYPEVTWVRQDNAGKKHAQAACWARVPGADVIANIDSDSAMEPHAIENGLRPFADDRVQAVAAVEMAHNYRVNLLTRAMAARSLAFQLFAMASQSVAGGQVLIAPGAFSLFRGGLLRDVKDAYVGETFAGIPVTLGDDTMLTFFALMRGRVVQQPSAVCFPAYPERLSHHLRQWTRWMRASTIRQVWRLRYLPLASYGWWFSVWQLGAFTAGVAATAFIVVAWPASVPLLYGAVGGLLGWPLILASRLFCVRRSDQSWLGVWAGVALMPFAALWYLLVLRQIRFYGMWTAARQGWVTRKKVEVRLHEGES